MQIDLNLMNIGSPLWFEFVDEFVLHLPLGHLVSAYRNEMIFIFKSWMWLVVWSETMETERNKMAAPILILFFIFFEHSWTGFH